MTSLVRMNLLNYNSRDIYDLPCYTFLDTAQHTTLARLYAALRAFWEHLAAPDSIALSVNKEKIGITNVM